MIIHRWLLIRYVVYMTINLIGYSRQQFAGPHVKGTAPLVTDEMRYVASLSRWVLIPGPLPTTRKEFSRSQPYLCRVKIFGQ